MDEDLKVIKSTTGQLTWNYSDKGYFEVNSPGTQGVVGFAQDKSIELDDFSLKVRNPFGIVLFTSLDKRKTIKEADKILITALARARNTGTQYNEDASEILDIGTAPVLMEGVMTDIKIKRGDNPEIIVLDHVGRKTDITVPLKNNKFIIDGGSYETIYYLIEY